MKHLILAVVLTLCLCISSQFAVYAGPEDSSPQRDAPTEASTSIMPAREAVPTPAEAHEAMIALKDQDAYKEGTTWTDYEPYSDTKGYYRWKGGTLGGANIVAVGCVAFAFRLSDEAFGSLPARMYAAGGFKFEDIKVGDILRVNNDTHTVIVLEVSDSCVIVAEGNYSGKVHWGRSMFKNEVMNNTSHYITRYPKDYIPPNDPTANEIIKSATFGEKFTWTLTKAGTLTISGNGAMPDFSGPGEQPWNAYNNQIRKIAIGNGVTSIGSSAFYNCGVLSAEIPSSVKTIGNNAFYKSSIVYATIPSGVKTIGDNAFRLCQNLSAVTISKGVETIGQNAFYGCTSLTDITLPDSIGDVGAGAFFQCTKMTNASFTAGSKQVTLGDNIFTECYYLMSVTLPKKIDRIGDGMFQNCKLLAGVEIPEGAASIGTNAFASSGVSVVIIPETVTAIEIAAFANCPLSDIYFTGTEAQWKGIRKIGDTAAAVAKATMHYNYIPPVNPDPAPGDGGNTGGSGDNSGNGGSSGSTGNDGSTDNTNNDGNSNNTDNDGNSDNTDNDGNSDNTDNDGNSDNSNNSGSQAPYAKGKTFTVSKITYKVTKAGKEVQLTKSKSTAKKVTVNTVTGADGVKYKVTSIGSKAMQKNKKMTSLAIGANVKTIGTDAFSGCTKLAKVTFGKNITSIGTNAFKGCTALAKTLTLPDSVKTIGANAFSGCKKITAVTIGKTSKSSLKTIGKSAFNGCKKLGKVTVKSTKLSSAGKQAFKGTKSSLTVKVPSKQLTKYKKLLTKAGLKAKQVTK